MDYPKVFDCTCGCSPKFFRRLSITREVSSMDCITALEFCVECPSCKGCSPWVEVSQGGVKTAALLWNDMVCYDSDELFRSER